MGTKPASVDAYIAAAPAAVREILNTMRRTVREAAPAAVESIGYRMPAYKLRGKPLAYFAAFQRHIGFYPTPSPIEEFAGELAGLKVSKGAVQLPLDKPIPYDLVRRMVLARAKQLGG